MSKVVTMKRETVVTGNQEMFGMIMGTLQRTGNHCMAYVPEGMLDTDADFQRIETRDSNKIKNLVATWDPNQMDPLVVVPHPETGTFSVVDGFGRLTAARILGLTHLECHVITNAPENIFERKQFEAKMYLHQIDNVEKLKPVQMHKARVLTGDKAAMLIDAAMQYYKCSIVSDKGRREPGFIGSYTRTYHIAKVQGEAGLRFVFDTCKLAGYDQEANGYNADVFRSLSKIYGVYGNVESIIGAFMRPMKPSVLKAKAVAKYPERSPEVAITLLLQDRLVEILNVPRKIDKTGRIVA